MPSYHPALIYSNLLKMVDLKVKKRSKHELKQEVKDGTSALLLIGTPMCFQQFITMVQHC